MSKLKEIIAFAQEKHAFQIILDGDKPPFIRSHEESSFMRVNPIDHESFQEILKYFASDEEIKGATNKMGEISIRNIGDLSYQLSFNPKPILVINLVTHKDANLADLNLPSYLEALVKFKKALILITGPRNSGKTTIMQALTNKALEENGQLILSFSPIANHFKANDTSLIVQLSDFSNVGEVIDFYQPNIVFFDEITCQDHLDALFSAVENSNICVIAGFTCPVSISASIKAMQRLYPADEISDFLDRLSINLEFILSLRLIEDNMANKYPIYELMKLNPNSKNNIKTGDIQKIFQQNYSGVPLARGMNMVLLAESIAELKKRLPSIDNLDHNLYNNKQLEIAADKTQKKRMSDF